MVSFLVAGVDQRAVDQMPVGQYAVQFLWDDAHYTGIYTYRALRAWDGTAPAP